MRVETADLFHDLAELRVRHARRRLNDNRFIHPIGNHFADARFARRACVFRRKRRWLRRWLSILRYWFGHKLFLLLRFRLFSWNGLRLLCALREDRLYPRHLAPDQTQSARLLELAALLLQAQMQPLLAKIAPLR